MQSDIAGGALPPQFWVREPPESLLRVKILCLRPYSEGRRMAAAAAAAAGPAAPEAAAEPALGRMIKADGMGKVLDAPDQIDGLVACATAEGGRGRQHVDHGILIGIAAACATAEGGRGRGGGGQRPGRPAPASHGAARRGLQGSQRASATSARTHVRLAASPGLCSWADDALRRSLPKPFAGSRRNAPCPEPQRLAHPVLPPSRGARRKKLVAFQRGPG